MNQYKLELLAFLYTLGCCLISIIIAGKSAGSKENKKWFENLNHPDNSLMIKYMNSHRIFIMVCI